MASNASGADAKPNAGQSLVRFAPDSALRLLTSPNIYLQPTPIAEAVDSMDATLDMPGVWLAPLGPERPRLRQLCLDKQIRGNDLPDA